MKESMFERLGRKFLGRVVKSGRAKIGFSEAVEEFCREMGTVNGWAPGTYEKFDGMRRHVMRYDSGINIDEIGENTMIGFVRSCEEEGLRNTTVRKQVELLQWFLRWAKKQGYVAQTGWEDFQPKLKVAPKTVVFLTWEELERVRMLKFGPEERQMEQARDLFCLQCYTSLRYSDVKELRLADVREDHIEVVTRKTNERLIIELNKYSREVLRTYEGRCGLWAMPQMSMQWVNHLLKEVGRRAEITERVKRVWYEGSVRMEDEHEKWELVTTHCGRRTFICNSLMMGIPPEVVMKWTGHSNYKAMKPYIAVADRERRKAMELWDRR